MQNIVSKFDLFGQNIILNQNSKQYYTTFVGGLTTLSFIAVMGIFLVVQTINFAEKNDIRVQSQTQYNNDPPFLNMNKDNFMFAISIEQPDEYPFNESPFFNIEVRNNQYHKINGEKEKKKEIIQMIPCTLEHWTGLADESKDFNSWQDDYEKNGFSTWLCPPLDYQFDLQGVFSSDFFDFISFTVYPCDNTNETKKIDENWQPVCASEDDGSFRLQIYTSNFVVNPQQKQNHQVFMSSDLQFTFIPGEMFRKADIYYQSVVLNVDDSIGTNESIVTESFPVNDTASMREQFELNKPNDQYAKIFFKRSKFTIIHNISYQKLFDLVSYIGGFTEVLLSIVGIFICYYNRQDQLINLANKLYNYDLEPQSKQQEKPKHYKDTKKKYASKYKQNVQLNKPKQKQSVTINEDISKSEANNISSSRRQKGGAEIRDLISSRFQQENQNNSQQIENQKKISKSVTYQKKKSGFGKNISSVYTQNNQNQINTYNSMINMSSLQQDAYLDEKEIEQKVKNTENLCKDLGFKTKRQYLTFQFQELVRKSKEVKLGIDYFIYKLSGGVILKTKKNKLIDKSLVLLQDQMDVTRVIKKMVEVEKIKHLLLNQDQLVLFNYFPKPLIKIDEANQINSLNALEQQKKKLISNQKKYQKEKFKKSQTQIKTQLRLNLNTYLTVLKAKNKFLSLLKSQKMKIVPTTLDDYKKLYTAYENVMDQNQMNRNLINNQQLIELVGKEMRDILYTSNLIKYDQVYLNEIKRIKNQKNQELHYRTFKDTEFNQQIQKAEFTIQSQQLGFLSERQETQTQYYSKFQEEQSIIREELKDKQEQSINKSQNQSNDILDDGSQSYRFKNTINQTQEDLVKDKQQIKELDQSNILIPNEDKLGNSTLDLNSHRKSLHLVYNNNTSNYNNNNISFQGIDIKQ